LYDNMVNLVTYRDVSESCSKTFKKHSKDQIESYSGWSGFEYEIIDEKYQPNTEPPDTTTTPRFSPSRRNRSAKSFSDKNSSRSTHPKRSASTHARLPASLSSITSFSKSQTLHQSVRNIQFEFAHFEDWKDHIEHYRSTVTSRVQHKYVEYNAPGFTARRQASLHENSDVYRGKLLARQQLESQSLRPLTSQGIPGPKNSRNRAKMSTVEMSVIPELTPHRLESRGDRQVSRGDRQVSGNKTTKSYDPKEAYRRMEYLGTCLHRKTVPSIQNIREPTRDLQLRVSNSLGGMDGTVTNPPVIQ